MDSEFVSKFTIVFYLLSFIFSIVILVRWWKMTSDIKDIRNYFCKPDLPVEEFDEVEAQSIEIEKMKSKMKPNQLIVKILRNQRLEIWDKTTWDEHISQGKGSFFEEIYKNY